MHDCGNSITNTLELPQSCTRPSIYAATTVIDYRQNEVNTTATSTCWHNHSTVLSIIKWRPWEWDLNSLQISFSHIQGLVINITSLSMWNILSMGSRQWETALQCNILALAEITIRLIPVFRCDSSHYEDKTDIWLSYLYNGNSNTGKTSLLRQALWQSVQEVERLAGPLLLWGYSQWKSIFKQYSGQTCCSLCLVVVTWWTISDFGGHSH